MTVFVGTFNHGFSVSICIYGSMQHHRFSKQCIVHAGASASTHAEENPLRSSELVMTGGPLQSARAAEADFGVRLCPPCTTPDYPHAVYLISLPCYLFSGGDDYKSVQTDLCSSQTMCWRDAVRF